MGSGAFRPRRVQGGALVPDNVRYRAQRPMTPVPVPGGEDGLALGRAATVALHDELSLAPKPGLVSFVDSGSPV